MRIIIVTTTTTTIIIIITAAAVFVVRPGCRADGHRRVLQAAAL